MSSGCWSCSSSTRFDHVPCGAIPRERVWAKSCSHATDSTSVKTVRENRFSTGKPQIHQDHHCFLQTRKIRRWHVIGTRLHVSFGLSRGWRREQNTHKPSWVEKHIEMTEKHRGPVDTSPDTFEWNQEFFGEPRERNQVTGNRFTRNQPCHKEGQRWRIIGHTIESDIYPKCPKGEQP